MIVCDFVTERISGFIRKRDELDSLCERGGGMGLERRFFVHGVLSGRDSLVG